MGTIHTRKRVLVVNHRGLDTASGMVRAMQYKPMFENSASWTAEYTSRRSEFLRRTFHDPDRFRWEISSRIFRSAFARYSKHWHQKREDEIVERAADFDIVYVVKSPGGSNFYRRLSELSRPRTLIDANDAIWLPVFNWDDLPATLGRVHGVVCENGYIAEYVRQYTPNVFVVPDAPQVEIFDRMRPEVRRDPHRVTIGWIGGSATIAPLYRLVEPLEALFAQYPHLHLRIVGAPASRLPNFENVRYSCCPEFTQADMVREVLAFDIGLLPLFHNVDGLGRGTLKAKVYMSGGAVAVCENYGENPNLIQDGVNGMLAASSNEWYDKLDWLITHADERSSIGQRGLSTVREKFTAERVFTQLVGAFDATLNQS